MTNREIGLLSKVPMQWGQYRIIACCLALTAIDGFDMLAIGFAAPGIAAEWQIDAAMLGTVLAAELLGLAFGSILFGRLADELGRKPVIVGGVAVMAATMAGVALAGSIAQILWLRLATGLGIGAVLVGTNALAPEYASHQRRDTVVTSMALGFPIGSILGGLIASTLLREYGWRSVFVFGASVTALFVPLAMVMLRESLEFLATRSTPRANESYNRILAELNLPPVLRETGPRNVPVSTGSGWRGLASRGLTRMTVLITAALFAHFMSAFFLLKWIPKMVSDMGFAPATAGTILVWASVGGLFGSVLLSIATLKRGPIGLVLVALSISTAGVAFFGQVPNLLPALAAVVFVANAGANAATIGIFAIAVRTFPADLRGAGLGIAMGLGRGGAALGPFVGGLLINSGLSAAAVTAAMAVGSFIAGGAIFAIGRSWRSSLQEAAISASR